MQLRPFSMGQTVFSLSGDPGDITVLQHSTIPLMTQNHPERVYVMLCSLFKMGGSHLLPSKT